MFRFYHLLTYSGLALAVRLFFQTYCNILKNYFFPVFYTPGFSTESGCKDKAFYQFNPNFFWTFFLKKYSNENRNQIENTDHSTILFKNSLSNQCINISSKAGAKVDHFIITSKSFLHVFSRKNWSKIQFSINQQWTLNNYLQF